MGTTTKILLGLLGLIVVIGLIGSIGGQKTNTWSSENSASQKKTGKNDVETKKTQSQNSTGGKSLTVCGSGCQFGSIQQAIEKANNGDTIRIEAGSYRNNLTLNKDLILKGVGAKKIKIQGKKEDYPVLLVGPSDIDVQIDNITFAEAKGICADPQEGVCPAGISIVGKPNVNISSSVFSKNTDGIRIEGSPRIEGTPNVKIENCTSTQNEVYGITLWGSSQADISSVTSSRNGYGVAFNGSSGGSVSQSTFSENFNGLAVEDSASSGVSKCTISDNENGVTLRHSAQLEINDSKIIDNKTGIWTTNTMSSGSFKGEIEGSGNEIRGNTKAQMGLGSYRYLTD